MTHVSFLSYIFQTHAILVRAKTEVNAGHLDPHTFVTALKIGRGILATNTVSSHPGEGGPKWTAMSLSEGEGPELITFNQYSNVEHRSCLVFLMTASWVGRYLRGHANSIFTKLETSKIKKL